MTKVATGLAIGAEADSNLAAQAVAQAKISGEMPLAGPAEVVEATFVDEVPPEPPKATERHKAYDKYAMLKAVGELKKEYLAMGAENHYRAVLGEFGAKKRNDLPTNDGGKKARACYKALGARLAELEQWFRDHQFIDTEEIREKGQWGQSPVWLGGIKFVFEDEKYMPEVAA